MQRRPSPACVEAARDVGEQLARIVLDPARLRIDLAMLEGAKRCELAVRAQAVGLACRWCPDRWRRRRHGRMLSPGDAARRRRSTLDGESASAVADTSAIGDDDAPLRQQMSRLRPEFALAARRARSAAADVAGRTRSLSGRAGAAAQEHDALRVDIAHRVLGVSIAMMRSPVGSVRRRLGRDRAQRRRGLRPSPGLRLHRPQQIAGGKELRIGAAAELIDDGAAGAGIEHEMARLQERRFRHETAGEDDAVAVDVSRAAVALDLDALDASIAVDGDERVRVSTGTPKQARAIQLAGPPRGDARRLPRSWPAGSMPRMAHVSRLENDTSSLPTTTARANGTQCLQIDHLLQGAGGENAQRPAARNQPRARAASRACRVASRSGAPSSDAGPAVGHAVTRRGRRARSRQRSSGAELDAVRALDEAPRIGRAGHGQARNSRHAEPGWPQWRGTPPACCSRSSTTTSRTPRLSELRRGRQAGRSAADDDRRRCSESCAGSAEAGTSGEPACASSATRALQ